jgi:3',5'-cyclic AMP phosphodiesterase CpdA
MRVLHVSDLHAKVPTDPDQQQIVSAFLSDVAELEAARRFDFVVFSGDLADDGTSASFRAGREMLLDPLARALPGRPIVLVPGNHDVDRNEISDILELGLQQKIADRKSAAETVRAPEFIDATRRLSEWDRLHSAWYDGVSGVSAIDPLAFVHGFDVDDTRVGIAALNTAWRSAGDSDRGRLVVTEAQLDAALTALDPFQLKFVVMHHPLDWLAEFDANSVRRALEHRGVFVLSGHDHSPNPTSEWSSRGAALYSRAGCLYAGHDYSNSYTILDLHPDEQRVELLIRRWWPEREERGCFDQATDLVRDGRHTLPWPDPAAALPVHQVDLPDVLAPLAQIAQEHSVLEQSLTATDYARVDDFLVPPRFWPVPEPHVADAALDSASHRPRPIDPLAELERSQVVMICGGRTSGVTSALLYVLDDHFRRIGSCLPAYVRADRRISLGILNQSVASARARLDIEGEPPAPVLVAVDDVAPIDRLARARLLRFITENPNVWVLLGCHGDEHVAIAKMLRDSEVGFSRTFLGPFGRRELRQLATRIVGPESREVVQRVLDLLQTHRLPRNPLNIAALIAVVARERDVTDLNESGLLQSYVTLLLESPLGLDPEGLGMDYRRREVLLARFARVLVLANRSRLPWGETEQFVLDYFEEIGLKSASAGRFIDSLVERRVLISDDHDVGFRYPALLYLFAAKWMLEDDAFAQAMLLDPLRNREIIRHAVGLKRTDPDLLRTISSLLATPLTADAAGVRVEQFDLLEDRHGWSMAEGLEDARALVQAPPEPPTEDELDQIYEEVVDDAPETTAITVFDEPGSWDAVDEFAESLTLLASVLKNSELVADVSLKAATLKQVLTGWAQLTVIFAVQEDESGTLGELLATLFEDDDKENESAEMEAIIGHFVRLFVLTIAIYSLRGAVGTRYLQGVLDEVMDDGPFMDVTAQAFFATMLYAMLELPQWPARLKELHDKHGSHTFVREIIRRWALRQYFGETLGTAYTQQVENLLADVVTAMLPNVAGVEARNDRRARAITDLRRQRTQSKWALREDSEDEADQDLATQA